MFPTASSAGGGNNNNPAAGPGRQHTRSPIITGTSVLGVVYDGGVMLAADTLLSYGSMAKQNYVSRLHAITGTNTIIGGSGEYSDFQTIIEVLESEALEETRTAKALMDNLYANEDGQHPPMTAASTWNYLRFLMYSRRNKFNPYWNDIVVAGVDKDNTTPFLGMVDKIGTTVKDNILATGFGSYIALPLLRDKWNPKMSEGDARSLLEDCCRVLFYRDCRASNTIQIAKVVPGQPPLVSDPYALDTYWDAPDFINTVGIVDLEGDGGW